VQTLWKEKSIDEQGEGTPETRPDKKGENRNFFDGLPA